MSADDNLLPPERIVDKIFQVRGERVMLDIHLAEFYGVETRALKQAVRRNRERFPEDFMFELSEDETNLMVSQFVIPSKQHLGGATPFAFTESGVAMISSVLRSPKAVAMNIAIVRTFVALRRLAIDHKDLADRLSLLENRYDSRFSELYDLLNKLLIPQRAERNKIGYKPSEDSHAKKV